MHTGKRQYKLTWLLEKGSASCKRWSDFNLLWNLSKRHLKKRTCELELVRRAFARVMEHESKKEGSDYMTICAHNLTPIKELRHKIYQNWNSTNCHEIEWNIQMHVQSCRLAHKTNPPYGKRWRLYILQQFLSNLTRPITHNVIFFFGGGGGAKFVPVIATLPILGLKLIKLFCAFLWALLWFSFVKNCG